MKVIFGILMALKWATTENPAEVNLTSGNFQLN